jgi:hypothetical protein
LTTTENKKSVQPAKTHGQVVFWPTLALIFVMVLAFLCASMLSQLSLARSPDSIGYEHFAKASAHEILESVRTLGYPILLKGLAVFNPTFSWLPALQLLIHFMAVLCFFRALITFGAPASASCAASIALVLSALNDGSFSFLLTDSVGQSLALLAIAGCFWAVSRATRWWPPILIALAALVCYQMRPVYLMLVGFLPCLVLMLFVLHPQSEKRFSFVVRLPAVLLALLLGPFLLFCTFRWATVGHFGLVSFTGWNQVGITAEMLTEDSIRSRLPARWKELSSLILEERARLGMVPAIQKGKIDYQQWLENYVEVQRVALLSATKLVGENAVMINRLVSQFSWDLIKSSPKLYLEFVIRNLFRGIVFEVINGHYVLTFSLAALILLFYRRQLILGWKRQTLSITHLDPLPSYVRDALALTAALFLILQAGVICLIEHTIRRYMHSAGMLMPALVGLLILREIKLFPHSKCPGRKILSGYGEPSTKAGQ